MVMFFPRQAHSDSEIHHFFMKAQGGWTDADSQAVEQTGGQVSLFHAPTGFAYVQSASPDFLESVQDLQSFSVALEDEGFDFDFDDTKVMEVSEDDITPDDEWFFDYQWSLQAIEAPAAWAAGCDGEGARVAVIDTGISAAHPDIAPNLDFACSFSTVPGFQFDEFVHWHGTHVAGIVAGADNGLGTIGVAPSATLMHIKALHPTPDRPGYWSEIIMGILFAADPESFDPGCTKKADIINMSLGAYVPKRHSNLHRYVLEAMNFAASKGVLVISSAGNAGLNFRKTKDLTKVPGTLGTGIAVSATGPTGVAHGNTNYRRIASYTNYGNKLIDLAGPGGDFTLYPNGLWYMDMVLGPHPYGWVWAAGTSMASPAVAGVAALIKGANPNISLGKLKTKLFRTADDEGKKGNDEYYGHGFVNAYRACIE